MQLSSHYTKSVATRNTSWKTNIIHNFCMCTHLCPFLQMLPQIICTSTTCFPEYLSRPKVTKIYRINNAAKLHNKITSRKYFIVTRRHSFDWTDYYISKQKKGNFYLSIQTTGVSKHFYYLLIALSLSTARPRFNKIVCNDSREDFSRW